MKCPVVLSRKVRIVLMSVLEFSTCFYEGYAVNTQQHNCGGVSSLSPNYTSKTFFDSLFL